MVMKHYADANGNPLPSYDEGNSNIPAGAVETTSPAPHSEATWNVGSQQWDGYILTWDLIRDTRKELISEVIEILDKYRNQQLQTGGAADIDAAKATEWADYFQLLRDLPTDYANPDAVIWPTKPT